MKILFDDQVFTWQKFGGISRYFTQIISNFPAEINAEISIKYSDNEYLHNANIINGLENIYQPIDHFLFGIKLPGKRKLFKLLSEFNSQKYLECSFLNKKLSIEHLKNQDFDIFHPTYYDDYFLQYLGNKPFVLTIHDMIHEIYPEITNNPKISEQKASLAKCASHIIAVSERTKKDIIDILGVSPNKISVVYHANSLTNNIFPDIIIKEKFILYVGERKDYKNFLFFVRSIESILKENKLLNVVCVGKNFEFHEIKLLIDMNIQNQFIAQNFNDNELAFLYKNACCLVFPSYYEGFGIPIVEAFYAGCPVVLSNSSCFPEIARDAAVYFNPKNILEINSAIRSVLYNQNLREILIEKGFLMSKRFSWQESACQMFEIYKMIYEQH